MFLNDLWAEAPAAVAYRDALPADAQVRGLSTAVLDRTGVPAWAVSLCRDGREISAGAAYGLTDGAAVTSAMGEMSEHFHTARFVAAGERIKGSYRELVHQHGERHIVDLNTLCLPAGSPVDDETSLLWMWGERWGTEEAVLLPLELVSNEPRQLPPGYSPFTTPITNGGGAGLSMEHAIGHGVLELLQRDGNGLAFRALDQGVVLDIDDRDLDRETADLKRHLSEVGIRVLPKFATDEFAITNLFVVGADTEPGRIPDLAATAAGEAAHPDRQIALRKAMLEFAAARVRKLFRHGPLDAVAAISEPGYLDAYADLDLSREEPRALQQMAQWVSLPEGQLPALLADTVLSERSRMPFSSLPHTPHANHADRLTYVAKQLAGEGIDILFADCSPGTDSEVRVVRVIAPGLEVETLSYYRIGERNARKLLERQSSLVGQGRMPDTARSVCLTAEATERLGGPVWLDIAAVDRLVGALYPLYREPSGHAVQLYLRRRGVMA